MLGFVIHPKGPPFMRYSADITAGALRVPESRVIAGLLLREIDAKGWQEAIYEENVLQTRNPRTAKRLRTLLRKRLDTMDAGLWEIVRDGSGREATHACLAATIKHSQILGDFLDQVVREQYKLYAETLSKQLWGPFIEGCRGRDPEMPNWTETTIQRLRSTVFQILAEAGYIENTRTKKLQTVHIAKPVLHFLQSRDERYVLRCIQVAP